MWVNALSHNTFLLRRKKKQHLLWREDVEGLQISFRFARQQLSTQLRLALNYSISWASGFITKMENISAIPNILHSFKEEQKKKKVTNFDTNEHERVSKVFLLTQYK